MFALLSFVDEVELQEHARSKMHFWNEKNLCIPSCIRISSRCSAYKRIEYVRLFFGLSGNLLRGKQQTPHGINEKYDQTNFYNYYDYGSQPAEYSHFLLLFVTSLIFETPVDFLAYGFNFFCTHISGVQ